MAEALFDEHPLGDYLRDSDRTIMPGSLEPILEDTSLSDEDGDEGVYDVSEQLSQALTSLTKWISTRFSANREFGERFKYIIISSSLLTSSLPVSPVPFATQVHSTGLNSSGISSYDLPPGRWTLGDTNKDSESHEASDTPLGLWLACIAGVVSLLSWTLLVMSAVAVFTYIKFRDTNGLSTMPNTPASLTIESLHTLISAGNQWDAVVSEAMGVLEKEERNLFYGPAAPQSPSSTLRVALHSTLHTTHVQSDNVRQLFAPLTSPIELSLLSEMYAPPSPMKLTFQSYSQLDHPRPASAGSPWSSPTTPSVKRSTWSGPPSANLNRKGSKTRSRLPSIAGGESSDDNAMRTASGAPIIRAPVTPSRPNIPQAPVTSSTNEATPNVKDESFGVSALELQRNRQKFRNSTVDVEFHLAEPPSRRSSLLRYNTAPSSALSSPSSSFSSRFTTLQTTRHPLSLSALHNALQAALASKRYAAAHLLALRFDEGEDEAYWEDVRSVVALLTSALEDAAYRLGEALEEAAKGRRQEQIPSPLLPSTPNGETTTLPKGNKSDPDSHLISFAPTPTHLRKFASHMESVSRALDEARTQIEVCLAALQADVSPGTPPSDEIASAAYEHLRRELGAALRECERGRVPLLEIVKRSSLEGADGIDHDEDDVPALHRGRDSPASISDPSPLSPPETSRSSFATPTIYAPPEDSSLQIDDATLHLLLTSTADHLPAQGIEQVFEASTEDTAPFKRERSKLSREERIKAAKLKRESGSSVVKPSSPRSPDGFGEAWWGPGGDVVQELKDVIWQVGEKKRNLSQDVPLPRSPMSDIPNSPNRPSRPSRPLPPPPPADSVVHSIPVTF